MIEDPEMGPRRDGRDDELTHALRRLFRAPVDEQYWAGLQSRITARVMRESDVWWQPFGRWVGVGIGVAAAALLLVGFALERARDVDGAMAYQAEIGMPRPLVVQMAAERALDHRREATLRYLISP